MAHDHGSPATAHETLTPEQSKKLMAIATAILVVGLAACGAAFAADQHRFGFSYLVGFMWATTIALGGLGWTIIWRLTKAGWPVAVRRQAEWLAGFLLVAVILFIPVVVKSHDIYHHWMGEQAASDPLLQKKQAWLNPTGFYIRAVVYLGLWALLANAFRRWSFKQDASGDKALTQKAQWFAAPSVLGYALSVSFAGFDWVMSLDPHWYSTIYGVYIFAAGMYGCLATLGIITVALRKTGRLGKVLNVEHQHDVGKLMFGFIVFWAYIAFSQFILIWYANIPEETIWYRHRWEHGWKPWSLLLMFSHFFIPFLYFLSRHPKRHSTAMVVGATLMLFAHFVDMYFLVMPTASEHFSFSWIDIAAFLGPAAVLFFVIARQIAKGPLYPPKDPRLAESQKIENL